MFMNEMYKAFNNISESTIGGFFIRKEKLE